LNIYFVRHGRAEEQREGLPDGDRQLTDAGRRQLRAAAPLWRRLNLRPDAVLSSPLARARQTAELLVEGIGSSRAAEVDARLGPGARWSDFAQALADRGDKRRVALVGHEPDLSLTILLLAGGGAVRMRPGGVACIEFPGVPEPSGGEIAWLLDPDLYADD
jgi:phosphohistidine phosphatase